MHPLHDPWIGQKRNDARPHKGGLPHAAVAKNEQERHSGGGLSPNRLERLLDCLRPSKVNQRVFVLKTLQSAKGRTLIPQTIGEAGFRRRFAAGSKDFFDQLA
ncbi:MAG: hypothetical protein K8R36_10895 [Planctomycetales bacterium]|nr:hypothetical protein [Planctomycetales bacterium]